jgi:hypothetical protein
VLLGGGVATMLAACGDERRRQECERARAELRPDAAQICARSSGSGGSSHAWISGRSGSDSGSATVSGGASRGGFGSTASSAGS